MSATTATTTSIKSSTIEEASTITVDELIPFLVVKRIRLGYTFQDMAKKLNWDVKSVSKFESAYNAELRDVYAYAGALGLELRVKFVKDEFMDLKNLIKEAE